MFEPQQVTCVFFESFPFGAALSAGATGSICSGLEVFKEAQGFFCLPDLPLFMVSGELDKEFLALFIGKRFCVIKIKEFEAAGNPAQVPRHSLFVH
jgi:hypothetical protein